VRGQNSNAIEQIDVGSPQGEAMQLYQALTELRAEVSTRSQQLLTRWQHLPVDSDFHDSAVNLADWLALRQCDVSELQGRLACLGVSSLGRCESHVIASIDAVLATLAVLAHRTQPSHPPAKVFSQAKAKLIDRRDKLFGIGTPDCPETRIMVTLPSQAADDRDFVTALINAGADCLRINTAHDGPEVWTRMVENVRAASTDRHVPVMMDLAGPKLRITGLSSEKKLRLHPGDRFALASSLKVAKKQRRRPLTATLSHPEMVSTLNPGDRVWIDDGVLRSRVVERTDAQVILEVTHARPKGGKIKIDKGVNLPGREFNVPALTESDHERLEFVVNHADLVGFSFVQTAQDVRDLLAAMRVRAGNLPLPGILLKIETPKAVANLPSLIVEAAGEVQVAVMIARGDLAVEIGLDRLSEIQEEILWLCEAARVPVVWATQVLEGLLKDGLASRAEATDAAMAQRADCVMLNKGPHAVEAVRFLRDILSRMDRHQIKKTPRMGKLNAWSPIG